MRSNFTRYGGFSCFARLIGKVRIIAANARTAAVCPRAGASPGFRPAPSMRVMDGCVLLAVVFALMPKNSLATKH
ncbi:MAG: hypothetical protein IPL33_18100 [Sphingobacteriales bacterium]|nr:hypothetical protein [Sphingobacteriales bacterium]